MSQLSSCVLEKGVCALPKVDSLSAGLDLFCICSWLELWVSNNHWGNLEENHLSSYLLNDVIGTLERRNKATVLTSGFCEVIW